jgi:FKBP-type peptidyl-prolyl cis-trans isomerase 2
LTALVVTPSIREVDREQLTEGEHVELAVEGSGHRVYITAVEGQTVTVVGDGNGEQASISLTGEKWRLNAPEMKG